MKQRTNLPLMIVFGLATVILIISIAGSRMSNNAESQLKISLIFTSLGGLIALLSGVLLLSRAASGAEFRELLPFTLPLLAGALMTNYHWSTALALGLLGVALMVRDMVGTPSERRGEGESESETSESSVE